MFAIVCKFHQRKLSSETSDVWSFKEMAVMKENASRKGRVMEEWQKLQKRNEKKRKDEFTETERSHQLVGIVFGEVWSDLGSSISLSIMVVAVLDLAFCMAVDVAFCCCCCCCGDGGGGVLQLSESQHADGGKSSMTKFFLEHIGSVSPETFAPLVIYMLCGNLCIAFCIPQLPQTLKIQSEWIIHQMHSLRNSA